jgi:5'-3' exonuclease
VKLIVIDTSVILYHIIGQINHHWDEWCPDAQIYAENAIGFVDSLGWVPNLLKSECKVIWLEDRKPYWKAAHVEAYKGKRAPKPSMFADVMSVFESSGMARLGFDGYEADDIAGAIVRLWQASDKQKIRSVYLATVDSDWMGLLVHPEVSWLCTGNHLPRVRQRSECYHWVAAKWKKQSKKWKAVWELPHEMLFRADAIWDWKAAVGDKSDNLPPGSDIGLINLLKPPAEHDLSVTRTAEIHRAIVGAKVVDGKAFEEYRGTMLLQGVGFPIAPLFVENQD